VINVLITNISEFKTSLNSLRSDLDNWVDRYCKVTFVSNSYKNTTVVIKGDIKDLRKEIYSRIPGKQIKIINEQMFLDEFKQSK